MQKGTVIPPDTLSITFLYVVIVETRLYFRTLSSNVPRYFYFGSL